MLYWHVLSLLVSLVISAPLESGQPGGPWTEQEIDIVRAKVLSDFFLGLVTHVTLKAPGQ